MTPRIRLKLDAVTRYANGHKFRSEDDYVRLAELLAEALERVEVEVKARSGERVQYV